MIPILFVMLSECSVVSRARSWVLPRSGSGSVAGPGAFHGSHSDVTACECPVMSEPIELICAPVCFSCSVAGALSD